MIGISFNVNNNLLSHPGTKIGCLEICPENWMGKGGYWKNQLDLLADKYPLFAHGSGLSLGSTDKINKAHLKEIKSFLDQYNITHYSDHLSYSQFDYSCLYHNLPLPFTQETLKTVSSNIKKVQDFLERTLIIENIPYYYLSDNEMTEVEFINAVIDNTGCELLLDINNVSINSVNHNYDPYAFIDGLRMDKVALFHIAGHDKTGMNLSSDVPENRTADSVYELLSYSMRKTPPKTVILEKYYSSEDMGVMESEIEDIQKLYSQVYELADAGN